MSGNCRLDLEQLLGKLLHEQSVILDSAIVGIIKVQDRHIIWANRAFEDMMGYAPGTCLGMPTRQLYQDQASYEAMGTQAYAALRGGANYRCSGQFLRGDGRLIWADMSAAVIDVDQGISVGAFLNTTERIEAEAALREREQRLKRVLEGSDQGFWDWNLQTHVFTASPRFETMLGYEPGEMHLAPDNWSQYVQEEDLARSTASIARHLAGEAPFHAMEFRIRCKSGEWRWILTRGRVVAHDAQGQPLTMSGTHSDVTERRRADEALRIAAIAFESQEGIFVTDAQCVILRVNSAFTQITGYSAAEAVGQTPQLLRSGQHDEGFYANLKQGLREHGLWQGEIWNRRKSGELYPQWLTISAVRDAGGVVSNYVATLIDTSQKKATENQIHNLAFYDPLTGLPNRKLLLDRLEQALASRTRLGWEGALLLIDLDNFKDLNDNLGHPVGDLLLQHVGRRIAACVRVEDTVARFGGDEYVVILGNLNHDSDDVAAYAGGVAKQILAALGEPYLLGERTHRSTASIGVTLFTDGQDTIEVLLQQADMAMYQAKSAGRNTLRFFDPLMQAAVATRAALEAGLHEAVQRQQFCLYFQAQVEGCAQLKGAEALVRWQHPQRGLVLPAEFIALAEASDLILQLGQWVLDAACAQLAAWAGQPHMDALTLSVNISARQLRQPDFVDTVVAALQRSGARAQRLKLELTESLLVADVDHTIEKMVALKRHGIGFALDDFGTGYSSLSYLKRLPLEQLKIDRSFVTDCLSDSNDAAIARMVIALANSLGLQVLAEGVQTEAQRQFLHSEGCQHYQGELFSAPVPLAAFEALARAATGSAWPGQNAPQ